jgi:predicted transcriptional regulator of viral defense system
MDLKHSDATKTVGPRAARLLTALAAAGKRVVSLHEIRSLGGLSVSSSRQFAAHLVKRGLLTRLRPGLFIVVPFELGPEREYLGNPYVVARELMRGASYYISHASAMDIHQMTTQPQLVVFVTSPKKVPTRTILGTEFRFVRCKREQLFGLTKKWVEPTEQVVVSNVERTVIDGLKQPEYCGGLTEVAKGFWMRRKDIDLERLVGYAIDLRNGAVIRRLGFLLESLNIDTVEQRDRLARNMTDHYVLADPALPPRGRYSARWRIRMNVMPEELRAVLAT